MSSVNISAQAKARIAALRNAAQAQAQEVELFGAQQQQQQQYGAGNKGKAFELLSKGLSPIVVARTLEISPALVSQYLAEEEFAEGVRAARVVRSTAVQVRDDKINALEDKALGKLGEVIDYITKPMEILQVVRTLNGLQRRAGGLDVGAGEDVGDRVVLHLPKHVVAAQVNLQFNTQNEVVEVSGRELRTMSSGQVLEHLLKNRNSGILEAQADMQKSKLPERSNEHEPDEQSAT